MSATEAVNAMRRGDITAEAYADALLARCEQGRQLNAFISLEPDLVRAGAREADRRRAKGARLGLLHGLPVPVKDSLNTYDLPTTVGTAALRHFRPTSDAACVTRLRAEGAYVLGKTNLHELSLGWTSSNATFGAVRNPYDFSRIPGGSSGGTAAAVAARMAPLGIAEDTQGSIRVPAALCGICGFRPTTGRYPTEGAAPITPLFDQVGPHARDVEDLLLFDRVVTSDLRPTPSAPLKGLRLGLAHDFFFSDLDPVVAEVLAEVTARLRRHGVEFVHLELPDLEALISRVTGPIQMHDIASSLTDWLRRSEAPVDLAGLMAQVSPDVKGLLERFALPGAPYSISPELYDLARGAHLPALRRLLAGAFAEHDVQALLFPVTLAPAPLIGTTDPVAIAGGHLAFQTVLARNISPGSTAGLPGLVLPAGLSHSSRVPIGLELDGPAGSDRQLLGIGLALQAVLPRLPAPTI